MYKNKLFDQIRNGKTAYGISINFPDPGMIEAVTSGWDYIWIDGQHGQFSYESLRQCSIAARSAGVDTIIRVPGHEFSFLGPVADLCPNGIMIPMVNDRKEAEEVVAHLTFPPKGHRSFWNTRAITVAGSNYYETQDLMVIVQIETDQGVQNAEEIARIEGVDVLMFGPADLGLSYGLVPGTSRNDNQMMMDATLQVIKAAKDAGKYTMFIAGNIDEMIELKEMGVDIVVCGSDYNFLKEGAERILSEINKSELL